MITGTLVFSNPGGACYPIQLQKQKTRRIRHEAFGMWRAGFFGRSVGA
jgi:hypothetical protein